MSRRLIINADDLGLARSVNDAIFKVHEAGNLSSATLMVAMPGTHDAVARASQYPRLALGLHFCITEGKAITGRSSLTDGDSKYLSRGRLFRKAISGHLSRKDVRREFEAQLDRMAELGSPPGHVDSHQHVHMIPAIFDAIMPVLAERNLPVRCVAPPGRTIFRSIVDPPKAMKQWMNIRFAKRLRKKFDGRTNDLLVSIHDLVGTGPYEVSTYRRLLQDAPEGAVLELMVHPYRSSEELLSMYSNVIESKRPFLDKCVAEYEILAGAPIFSDMELITFRDI